MLRLITEMWWNVRYSWR